MSLRSTAKYEFGLPFVRFMPLNDDLTIPTVTRMLGGTGPFDFSGVADDTAVALSIKQDDGSVSSIVVDVSAAVDTSAVTVAELVTALNSNSTPALTTIDVLASSGTGKNGSTRIKLESTDTSTTPDYIQVYGEFAEIAEFGQGFGQKFIKFDTMQTAGFTPTMKEDETFTVTDAQGKDTEIITDGYVKGVTGNVTDSAKDKELEALMTGGSYNSTTGLYEVGTSESTRYYFFMELYFPYYSKGTNQEADIVGYKQKVIRIAKGSVGEDTHSREWSPGNYTITGTSYTDEDGDLLGAFYDDELSIAEYNALTLSDV